MAVNSDSLLIQQIRNGDQQAWQRLIERYEGRLFAFAESRLRDHAMSEDVVQETFYGFLTSLPNYDDRRELQTWLFSIAGYKVTDQLRKRQRKGMVTSSGDSEDDIIDQQYDPYQPSPSSFARRDERRELEEKALSRALQSTIRTWMDKGDYLKVQVLELLFVKGMANRDVARMLQLSEQQVANIRFAAMKRIGEHVRNAGLSPDVFPELATPEAV
ncbi:RNA polymerase sigma factor [Tuwongella immobilis]|uniref:RNA polymerase sigma-70 region 2 domain-containing protein n=1 Tax=Tuwongella immobilis TaxID=692036 RepID=A0A6C2YQH9_9BACT|nr:sigma-70 family RNA polymerase sigma factor [Tuwongella immobilis]VIP03898.1 rna polymerase ecf-type sigma factor : RNA polymerase, sigma-24 subunit, ECF subfamily OS=Pirellula staleyi (strain ATCC 27377 / DSM 6068 / ICPB 4128) GN=Psta_2776 PE=4 SV=1: Sigma70_r2 [Tuwongella immobilis]VTS05163.1 rna polymerase ecf-type sigma factor : RNA polymerase, sigma-24 subunit, ECF subfamily OS=Pirellula staleyi (strain ATCC 27377 / DSM 6068 / ICPB 4128) GN=Psta_2776 PE=4 SV=1: Sigma70_r2 [Tuwongella immo